MLRVRRPSVWDAPKRVRGVYPRTPRAGKLQKGRVSPNTLASGKPYFGIEIATSDTQAEDALRGSMLMKLSGKPGHGIETATSVTEAYLNRFCLRGIKVHTRAGLFEPSLPEGHQGPYASRII